MSYAETILPEFDHELAGTRKVIERIPDDKLDWKAHPKSQTMGWNANHLADLPGWAISIVTQPEFDFSPPGGPRFQTSSLKTVKEILALFDKNVAAARKSLAEIKDSSLGDPWTLRGGERGVIFTMPRGAVLRSFLMNHIIHHRAILCVYLRLNNIPVPGLYGPSGDE
jgi:uncharacterized damage-inducible protein DinB